VATSDDAPARVFLSGLEQKMIPTPGRAPGANGVSRVPGTAAGPRIVAAPAKRPGPPEAQGSPDRLETFKNVRARISLGPERGVLSCPVGQVLSDPGGACLCDPRVPVTTERDLLGNSVGNFVFFPALGYGVSGVGVVVPLLFLVGWGVVVGLLVGWVVLGWGGVWGGVVSYRAGGWLGGVAPTVGGVGPAVQHLHCAGRSLGCLCTGISPRTKKAMCANRTIAMLGGDCVGHAP